MIEEMVARTERPLAIGVDARTRGFDAGLVLEALQRLRANPRCAPNWCLSGPTRPPCCAATRKPAAAIRWRRRAVSPTESPPSKR